MDKDLREELANTIKEDPRKAERIALRMYCSPRTIERWASGNNEPSRKKASQLRRILASYNGGRKK